MNTDIQIFENPEFGQIRTMTGENNEPWFVGKDVATVLGYANPSNALTVHVDKEDKTSYLIQVSGSNYKANTCFINESGLYSLILSSKLESAKRFKHWVTAVVLPQIRKTGGYIPVNEDDNEKTILCKALMIMKRTVDEKNHLIEAKQAQLNEQKPLVQFANAVTASDDSILIGELAKLIAQNGIEIGPKRLFRWLRKTGYLFKNKTLPIQKWVEKGLFELSVTVIETEDGSFERITTKVTGKGQKYFIDGFTSGRFSPLSPQGGTLNRERTAN